MNESDGTRVDYAIPIVVWQGKNPIWEDKAMILDVPKGKPAGEGQSGPRQ
jgi:hypothetical protein